MKMMVLSDPHQNDEKWELLCNAVREVRPEVVAIAGDLFPKGNGILSHISFVDNLREYGRIIRAEGVELVVIPGNDENQNVVPALEQGDVDGLWHYVADRVKRVKGYDFCGCPWVKDHPFGYKYWVVAQKPGDIYINPFQLSGPLLINSDNEIVPIDDYHAFLAARPAMSELLADMAAQVEDLSKSIWLIHDPPAGLELDVCGTGARVGSGAVTDFLSEYQPLMSVHGHIHESPVVNGNIWWGKIGRTLCIQAGQPDGPLHYATFELSDGKIANLTHSLYGPAKE